MQGGTVKLQVYQEVSSVLSSSLTSATGITTNKRSIESSVLVDENQIVVLGGLIQDSINNVQNKTPILGDIPILGNLFRYETRQRSKTNLMVFIRPYIMYQAEASQRLANERYGQIDQTRKDAKLDKHWMLPDDDTKEMPSLKVDDALGTSSPAPVTAVAEPNQP
jgi:general secretion pathway protein D